MSEDFAQLRLVEERNRWRKDHPPDFVARPAKSFNGEPNLFQWDCLIPGKPGSLWQGGYYKLVLEFPANYPVMPPIAKFTPPIPHLNVFPSGRVCLSILTSGWKPSLNLRQILLGIQNLLDSPNPESPAHEIHYTNFMKNRALYDHNIKECAAANKSTQL